MDTEKKLEQAKHDCLRWLKALHNLHRSERLMKRFADKANSLDHDAREALFQSAIVSYAKPFTRTETGRGKKELPTWPLKRDPAFDSAIHKHMMDLRNKLIAHDDFTEIEPRYVWVSIEDSSNLDGHFAPFQAYLRNSCISYPQDMEDISRMYVHVSAAFTGAKTFLDQLVVETRALLLSHPKEARLVFPRRPDSALGVIVGDGETENFVMDISAVETHPTTEVNTPYSSTSFGNYRHTSISVRVMFDGPQGISFDGCTVTVVPG